MSTPLVHKSKPKLASELDSGFTPHRKFSISKFIVFCSVAGLFVSHALAAFTISFGLRFLQVFGKPHIEIHQNQTWEQALTSGYRNVVVRPLIDRKQRYEVLVTVWLRRTEEEKHSLWDQMQGAHYVLDNYDSEIDWDNYDNEYTEDFLHEKAIFSDVVFSGLRLKNRNMFVEIPLQIPTQVFMSGHLSTSDLRASIVIIPSSPSLLDHVSDYSTWYSWMRRHRMRPSRFPPNSTKPPIRSFQDRLLEGFALNVDLIRIHEHQKPNGTSYDESSAPSDALDSHEEEVDCFALSSSGELVRASPSHILHPFIVTRTQVRINDQTSLFNRQMFVERHERLKSSAHKYCTVPRSRLYSNDIPPWTSCRREYQTVGNWETLMELHVPNEESAAGYDVEWAYAPYMNSLRGAATDKDHIPVPITRRLCNQQNNSSSHTESGAQHEAAVMNITWRLSFTGRTSAELVGDELIGPVCEQQWAKPNTGDDLTQYAIWTNGLVGHRHGPDLHPKRKFHLVQTRDVMSDVELSLKAMYWISQTSIEHISLQGTYLLVVYYIIASTQRGFSRGLVDWIWHKGLVAIPAVTMLSAVTTIARAGSTGLLRWIPVPVARTYRDWTSLEPGSTINRTVAMLLAIISGFYYIVQPEHIYLISPTYRVDRSRELLPALRASAWWTGKLCQLGFNNRSGVFAGDYKTTVFTWVIQELIELMLTCECVVGNSDEWRQGLSLQDVCRLVLLAATVWQAIRLPRPKPVPEPNDVRVGKMSYIKHKLFGMFYVHVI
ncbi:hypothetical protein Moror_11687 [Moniliophthora roreri MCA 2997]|uniref:Uncharacterized protein n=1 Tax=Moniliophthora roreri (strain MCA 2997) TaxID=1381753 RepID=V2Y6S3_MONRO|nr:hypothetical protein Moror_11687 [Moniliophthora roreri MCA 2997]